LADSVLEVRSILDRFRLDGRVALVTGAGRGIGRAFAHALGEAGSAVAVVDLDGVLAQSVVDELTRKQIDAISIVADLTRAQNATRMVDEVIAKWGRLDIGVNNAGIGMWHDAEEVAESDWDRVMDLNLKGVFLCAQAEASVMLPVGYGKIINTASMSAHIINTPQNQVAYNTSKAGVLHLTRSLAAEWAARGVRVNSISPGYTRTKLMDDLLETSVGQGMLPQWLRLTPMGRLGDVTDLQGAVVYLASEASDFMTGADLAVDGGYRAW
jgi:NAD(P)-dependent dehydrogenase (short-subunit alcohol dehydrogenase family)